MFLYPTYGNLSPTKYTQPSTSPATSTPNPAQTTLPVRGSDSSANSGFRDTGQRMSISGRDAVVSYGYRNGESVRVNFNDGSFLVGTFFDSRI